MDYDYEPQEPEEEIVEKPDVSAVQSLAERVAASMSPDDLKLACVKAAQQAVESVTYNIKSEVQTLVKFHLGNEIKAKVDALVQEQIQEILQTKIVITGESWSQKQVAVIDIVKKSLQDALDNLKRNNGESEIKTMFNKFVEKEVGGICSTALNEFKAELRKEFEKETMKKMIQGITAVIGSDKRLLAVLAAS